MSLCSTRCQTLHKSDDCRQLRTIVSRIFSPFLAENQRELAAIKSTRDELDLTAAASEKRTIQCEAAWSSTKLEHRLEDLHRNTELVQRAMPPGCCAEWICHLKLVSPLTLPLSNLTFEHLISICFFYVLVLRKVHWADVLFIFSFAMKLV